MRFHQRVRPAHPRSVLVGWGALSPQIPGPASLAPCATGLATVNGNVARRLARGRETAGVSTLVSQPADLQPRQADSHASGLLSAASHGRVRGVCVVVCGKSVTHAQAHLRLEPRLRRVQRQAHSRRCAVVSTKQSMAAQAGAARIGRRRIGWSIHILSTRS